MRFDTFDWDTGNVEHIARHDVDPSEAEVVCRSHPLVVRGRRGCYLAYGRNADGRYLLIVLRSLGGGTIRIITARDMTPRERRFYQGRH